MPISWRSAGSAALLALSLANTTLAANPDEDDLTVKLGTEWRLVKDDHSRDIRTWAKLEDGKRYRSFKIEVQLDADLDTIARVLFDFDNYPKWFWEVREAKLLKTASPTEHFTYIVHNAPLGLPDRDVILHTTIEPATPARPVAMVRTHSAVNYLPSKPPLVRMLAEETLVRFVPAAGGVMMTVEGYVDPGGAAPVWATNFVQRSAPYSIAAGIRRMVKQDAYRDPANLPRYSLGRF